jgi:hypothetical protein
MPGASGFLLDQLDGIPADAWERFRLDDDDAVSGAALVERVGTRLGNDLFVVTDASWRPDVGPFVLQAWRLSALVREHGELVGEPFFNNDVVILSPDGGAVIAIHHAGMLAVARGEPSPLPPILPVMHLTDSTVFASWDPPLEWSYLFGEIYPDTEVGLPSGRVLSVRWFETDPQVSFAAPTGDFQISYRGGLREADEACAEFLSLVGLREEDILRLSPHS